MWGGSSYILLVFFLGQVFYNLIAAEQGGHLADNPEDGFALFLFADGEGPGDVLRDRQGGFADRAVRSKVVQGVAQSADNGNIGGQGPVALALLDVSDIGHGRFVISVSCCWMTPLAARISVSFLSNNEVGRQTMNGLKLEYEKTA